MSTVRARDASVWFSKCGRKAVVWAPVRSVNLNLDRDREKVVDVETQRVCRIWL